MMSTQTFLVIGATGKTGQHTVQHLLEKDHAVRAMVHKEDERSEALRGTGVEVMIGELLEHDDVIRATAGTSAAYFCYPVSPGLIQATSASLPYESPISSQDLLISESGIAAVPSSGRVSPDRGNRSLGARADL